MDDHGGDRPRERRDEGGDRDHHHDRGGDRHRGGPPGTDWLQLEMSKVLQSSAERMVRDAAEEIIKDAMKARLRERLGPRLEAVGRLVADQLADDVEASLDIEGRIDAHREARRGLDARIAEALGVQPRPEHPAAPPGEGEEPPRT